ncbi:MAG: hypothetical protein M3Q23_14905, partial [Actinomycetota bacterium]|nr:hypothetical protein [Actinomycetota bacterium]
RSRRPGSRALGWAVAAATLMLFFLGFAENYWEVPQAILVGAMLLKAEYATMAARAMPLAEPGQRPGIRRVAAARPAPTVA